MNGGDRCNRKHPSDVKKEEYHYLVSNPILKFFSKWIPLWRGLKMKVTFWGGQKWQLMSPNAIFCGQSKGAFHFSTRNSQCKKKLYQDLGYGEILSGQPGAWLVEKIFFICRQSQNSK